MASQEVVPQKTTEIAEQNQIMAEQMTQCCKDGPCMLKPDSYSTMHLFGILVIAALAMLIVLQNKVLKELRKGKKK